MATATLNRTIQFPTAEANWTNVRKWTLQTAAASGVLIRENLDSAADDGGTTVTLPATVSTGSSVSITADTIVLESTGGDLVDEAARRELLTEFVGQTLYIGLTNTSNNQSGWTGYAAVSVTAGDWTIA